MIQRLMVIGLLMLCIGGAPARAYQEQQGLQPISPNQNLGILWAQVEAQPEDFAVACTPLNNRAGTVLFQPNERFPMASVSKILIFVEYARRVDAGQIPLNEQVNVATLNRFDLARTDRGAHDDFMDLYSQSVQTINLWDVASTGMIQYSSNAASDYMLARMQPIDWDSLYETLHITNSDHPHPLTMIPLMMNNHEAGQPTLQQVNAMSATQGEQYFNLYLNDEVWREAEINYRTARRRNFPPWHIQSAILAQHTAQGTVYDMLGVMSAIYSDRTALTEGTKQLVRSALRWEGYPLLDVTYSEYGSKLGFYSGGTLALAAYGDPFSGGPVVSVAFFRNIPRETYYQMLRQDSIGDFAHWMNLNACAGLQNQVRSIA